VVVPGVLYLCSIEECGGCLGGGILRIIFFIDMGLLEKVQGGYMVPLISPSL
jgi:hypothetical protein